MARKLKNFRLKNYVKEVLSIWLSSTKKRFKVQKVFVKLIKNQHKESIFSEEFTFEKKIKTKKSLYEKNNICAL